MRFRVIPCTNAPLIKILVKNNIMMVVRLALGKRTLQRAFSLMLPHECAPRSDFSVTGCEEVVSCCLEVNSCVREKKMIWIAIVCGKLHDKFVSYS